MKPYRTVAVAALALLGLLVGATAHAEIHIAYSIEAMTVEADVVVIGTITDIEETKGLGKKLEAGKLACTMTVTETLKVGEGATAPKGVVRFTADGLHGKKLHTLLDGKGSVLLFLRQTEQAYSLGEGKGPYDHWLLHEFESAPYLVDLGSLPTWDVLAGKDYAQPSTKTAVVDLIKDTVEAQTKALATMSIEDTKKNVFLDLPFETPAFKALYSGSSCFLYVPAFMFPKGSKALD